MSRCQTLLLKGLCPFFKDLQKISNVNTLSKNQAWKRMVSGSSTSLSQSMALKLSMPDFNPLLKLNPLLPLLSLNLLLSCNPKIRSLNLVALKMLMLVMSFLCSLTSTKVLTMMDRQKHLIQAVEGVDQDDDGGPQTSWTSRHVLALAHRKTRSPIAMAKG